MDQSGNIHTSLVMSKTKAAPIKRLTIPRLELCGAHLLSQLLHHCKTVFQLPSDKVCAWTDSTIVLNWLGGNPHRFKTYVGNRVSHIVELIAPDCWGHVEDYGTLPTVCHVVCYHLNCWITLCDQIGSGVTCLICLNRSN